MEMSEAVKPLTSFLIEDILSIKDGTRFNGKCCLQKKAERCSQWREESEALSEQLCPQETTFGVQTGELLQADQAGMRWIDNPKKSNVLDFYLQNSVLENVSNCRFVSCKL